MAPPNPAADPAVRLAARPVAHPVVADGRAGLDTVVRAAGCSALWLSLLLVQVLLMARVPVLEAAYGQDWRPWATSSLYQSALDQAGL